jgi:hypothetical protein
VLIPAITINTTIAIFRMFLLSQATENGRAVGLSCQTEVTGALTKN